MSSQQVWRAAKGQSVEHFQIRVCLLFCQFYYSSKSQGSCTTNSLCYVRDKTRVETVGMRGTFVCSLLDTEFEIR